MMINWSVQSRDYNLVVESIDPDQIRTGIDQTSFGRWLLSCKTHLKSMRKIKNQQNNSEGAIQINYVLNFQTVCNDRSVMIQVIMVLAWHMHLWWWTDLSSYTAGRNTLMFCLRGGSIWGALLMDGQMAWITGANRLEEREWRKDREQKERQGKVEREKKAKNRKLKKRK